MRREHKYVASFFLSAALMAPVGALAVPRRRRMITNATSRRNGSIGCTIQRTGTITTGILAKTRHTAGGWRRSAKATWITTD